MNRPFYGDNLDVLRERIPEESVDLVYLDPPFNSNRNYNVLFKQTAGTEAPAQIQAFEDTWTYSRGMWEEFRDESHDSGRTDEMGGSSSRLCLHILAWGVGTARTAIASATRSGRGSARCSRPSAGGGAVPLATTAFCSAPCSGGSRRASLGGTRLPSSALGGACARGFPAGETRASSTAR